MYDYGGKCQRVAKVNFLAHEKMVQLMMMMVVIMWTCTCSVIARCSSDNKDSIIA